MPVLAVETKVLEVGPVRGDDGWKSPRQDEEKGAKKGRFSH